MLYIHGGGGRKGEGEEKGDGVLEGWEEGRSEGRVEERGEIACSIITTTYASWRGRRGEGFGHESLQQL